MPVARTARGNISGSIVMAGAACNASSTLRPPTVMSRRAASGPLDSHWNAGQISTTTARRGQNTSARRLMRSESSPASGPTTKVTTPDTRPASSSVAQR